MKPKILDGVGELASSKAHQKVMHWFFSYPDSRIGINDLSSALKVSKSNVKRVVLSLEKEGFLNVEKFGRLLQTSCNHDHIHNSTKKVCYNLNLMYESGILDEVHKFLPNSKAVILFGSYRKGDDNEKSDIDIAAGVAGNEPMHVEELCVLKVFGYRKNVPVNLHIFSRDKIDINLFANIANGIVLEGFLEVRP